MDVRTLRQMVGHGARRFDQGASKKRRLVTRAMDVIDLSAVVDPKVRECIPYIRNREKELASARAHTLHLLRQTLQLEREVGQLRETERNNIVLISTPEDDADDSWAVAEDDEIEPRVLGAYARVLGIKVSMQPP